MARLAHGVRAVELEGIPVSRANAFRRSSCHAIAPLRRQAWAERGASRDLGLSRDCQGDVRRRPSNPGYQVREVDASEFARSAPPSTIGACREHEETTLEERRSPWKAEASRLADMCRPKRRSRDVS